MGISAFARLALADAADLLLQICGDKEVLRDEIIYCAHKAAHPELYPLRQPLRDMNKARAALGDTYGPTKVHLQ